MNRVKHIEIDLNTFKIVLRFQNAKDPLILHFDTPSRKFYFSLIALIVHEMKQQDHPGFIYLRKHEKLLKLMDDTLAGSNASGTIDGMWEKIRKAWHYSLPNLEEAANFSIEDREQVAPYEKGGKYLYECTEEECDIWASLFGIDEITNKWRFKFAVDEAWLDLSDVTIKLGEQQDDSAWDTFLRQIEKTSTKNLTDTDGESARPAVKTYPIRWQLLAMAVVVLFVMLISGAALLNRYLRPISPPTESVEAVKKSIAILPFINISDDPDKDYFCDGITEELINNLAKIKDLHVISRTSAFYFKDKGFNLRTIGQKLNVENILEGSVRISGDKLKISAQLIRVADDAHLWADTYTLEIKDIFDLQDNIAKEIVCNLKTRLGCEKEDLVKNYTENIEAYTLYLKGLHIRSRLKLNDMIEYFNKAIALDPDYALAYIGLADAYTSLGFFFGDAMESSYRKAKESILKALEIDDTLADAHVSYGRIQLVFEWDWIGAETSFKKAVSINPNNPTANYGYSIYLRTIGQTKESVEEMKKALSIDPFSYFNNLQLAIAYSFDNQKDNAVKQAENLIELFPDSLEAMTFLGFFLVHNQNSAEGISLLERALSLMKKESSFTLGFLGMSYGLSGDTEKAKNILDKCLIRWEEGTITASTIATIYAGLNDKDNVFKWLNTAIDKHDPRITYLKSIAHYAPFHSDHRWPDLIKKMGLDE